MRPPFAYYGGKVGLARQLLPLLPPHRVYMEPFLGSGALFFAKRPAPHEILNDLDGNVVAFFRCLRDRLDELEAACGLTPYSREEYDAADLEEDGLDDLERARRFWIRVNQGFGHTANDRTTWSVTSARSQGTAPAIRSRLGRFAACAERLAHASIERCDAAELVDRLATPETLVYADPPYVAASRSHHHGAGDYRVDMGGGDGHRRLAEALRATPATVVLSGYPSDLYDELYGDWHRLEVPTFAYSANGRPGAAEGPRPERVEVLWSNRPLDEGRLPLVHA